MVIATWEMLIRGSDRQVGECVILYSGLRLITRQLCKNETLNDETSY